MIHSFDMDMIHSFHRLNSSHEIHTRGDLELFMTLCCLAFRVGLGLSACVPIRVLAAAKGRAWTDGRDGLVRRLCQRLSCFGTPYSIIWEENVRQGDASDDALSGCVVFLVRSEQVKERSGHAL